MTNQEKDIRRLNLLGICHTVFGGIVTLIAVVGVIYFVFAVLFWAGMGFRNAPSPPSTGELLLARIETAVFLFFRGLGIGVLLIWCLAIGLFKSGRKLRHQGGRTFSMVIAGIECVMAMAFGALALWGVERPTYATPEFYLSLCLMLIFILCFILLFTLGIFTLITLNKKSVKELYKELEGYV